MRDLAGVVLSIGLPWVAGTLWVRALWRGDQDRRGALSVGYGYFVGAITVTLLLRLADLIGLRWNLAWVALPLLALAVAGWFGTKAQSSLRADWRRASASLGGIPPESRKIFWLFVGLCALNLIAIAAFVTWSLLVPYDALAQWGDKARVWYEYGRLMPFTRASDWLASSDPLLFWDPNANYPGTIPLLQVWAALCLGHWDESLINFAWVAGLSAFGLALYGQLRRLDTGPVKSIAFTYLLLTLPFLQVNAALAGIIDIFVGMTYALAVMSIAQWALVRQRQDLLLALALAAICATLKREGVLWSVTLTPALIVALHRRAGLALTALAGAIAIGYLLFGPDELNVMGYVLRTHFENVSLPVYQHMFLMDNWHLLWYAAIVVVAFNWRLLLNVNLAPTSITILAALSFIVVVFFFSNAAGGVDEESLLNRFLLQIAPALAFYLMFILSERQRQTLGGGASSVAAVRRPAA